MLVDQYLKEYTRAVASNFGRNHTKNGFDKMGKGKFGAVYSTKNSEMVLKVFHNDPPYVGFLKLVIENSDNPHFPKIGKLIQMKTGKYAGLWMVKSEKLLKLTRQDWNAFDPFLCAYMSINANDAYRWSHVSSPYGKRKYVTMDGKRVAITAENVEQVAEYWSESNPDFADALTVLISYEHLSNRLDLHSANFMKRPDGTLVITDPYWTGNREDFKK